LRLGQGKKIEPKKRMEKGGEKKFLGSADKTRTDKMNRETIPSTACEKEGGQKDRLEVGNRE